MRERLYVGEVFDDATGIKDTAVSNNGSPIDDGARHNHGSLSYDGIRRHPGEWRNQSSYSSAAFVYFPGGVHTRICIVNLPYAKNEGRGMVDKVIPLLACQDASVLDDLGNAQSSASRYTVIPYGLYNVSATGGVSSVSEEHEPLHILISHPVSVGHC